jgi:hypothetical protein
MVEVHGTELHLLGAVEDALRRATEEGLQNQGKVTGLKQGIVVAFIPADGIEHAS